MVGITLGLTMEEEGRNKATLDAKCKSNKMSTTSANSKVIRPPHTLIKP